ncbi:unnamed protein product [Clonostachys rosea f. rosea IK726]|uniref:Uncharacterized protein n=1 Tax=Clonostachys rosea f. rosea IK726 TaxID=1349383 RepID=A0ACA9UR63_BIOOC|nr:unnamed protein product [Clonostachys rosea f. rosea IK726]
MPPQFAIRKARRSTQSLLKKAYDLGRKTNSPCVAFYFHEGRLQWYVGGYIPQGATTPFDVIFKSTPWNQGPEGDIGSPLPSDSNVDQQLGQSPPSTSFTHQPTPLPQLDPIGQQMNRSRAGQGSSDEQSVLEIWRSHCELMATYDALLASMDLRTH